MVVSLTIINYKPLFIPFAFLAMAVHRLPLSLNKKCRFWKLMGSGKGGSFSLSPDLKQWALLTVWNSIEDHHDFQSRSWISSWWKKLALEKYVLVGSPISSHGTWDGLEPFVPESNPDVSGPVAVLTRATIRFSKLHRFWKYVDFAAEDMSSAAGYITSFGIGEAPFYRQATFSVWESAEAMKNYAYGSPNHREVIKLTRAENWYSEELFARFRIISAKGTLNGQNPLAGLISNNNQS